METVNAIGRRKSAIARIYINEGTGKITINDRAFEEYFPLQQTQNIIQQPITLAEASNKYDIIVNLKGGGTTGQAEALRLALARAMVKINPEIKGTLKAVSLLTRDPREVERKKPGQPGARKRFQFSKR
jgi:small subunit ribosomal protein S9